MLRRNWNPTTGFASLILLAALLGILTGIGLFTFGYARGASYLTDNPESCANCHVMREQFESWMKSSHGNVAVCNDCHTPSGLVPKYGVKALNGFFHSLAFTTGWFPDRIHITERNYRIADAACLKCHEQIVQDIRATRKSGQQVQCISCHREVGHM